jgi:hypothetical protein
VHARLLQQRGQARRAHRAQLQFWRGPMVFIRLLDEWRKAGTLPGLELTQ